MRRKSQFLFSLKLPNHLKTSFKRNKGIVSFQLSFNTQLPVYSYFPSNFSPLPQKSIFPGNKVILHTF